jgi:hypothetical protein
VIKKKVNQNARKAAKSNDYILWIHPWQDEHQWSVNDSSSSIMGNLGGDMLDIVINKVLAAFKC